jgi:hypothetical protein
MSNSKNSATDAAIAASGKATITSFRYFDKLCFATLSNGVSGIVGDTTACSLRDMLALKGSGIHVAYTQNGVWADKGGISHPRYQLSWSLE